MNVLVISSRCPWPQWSGDRMRASIWLEALTPHARVALVAPPGDVPHRGSFRYFAAQRVLPFRAAWRVMRERLPLQTLLAAPFAWGDAIDAARREMGRFDATIVVLSRSEPWIRSSLGHGRHILDSIDSLRRNASERASAASPLTRWFWRVEERRLAEFERRLAFDRVTVVSDDETREFGDAGMAIANSVRVAPLDRDARRRYDFAFWGRLAYFANHDAALCFLHEIVPAIRAQHPAATFCIGGADAPREIRRAAARMDVELQSPLADVGAFARSVRVAVIPMRYGSGQSSKLLEAAEAGCGVVTTPEALRGLPRIAPHVEIASDPASTASAALALLRDDERRTSMTAELRRAVQLHHSRDAVHAAMLSVVNG